MANWDELRTWAQAKEAQARELRRTEIGMPIREYLSGEITAWQRLLLHMTDVETRPAMVQSLGPMASSLEVAVAGVSELGPGVVCGEPAIYRCGWDHEPGVTTNVCCHHRLTRIYGGIVGVAPEGARCQAVGDVELGQG